MNEEFDYYHASMIDDEKEEAELKNSRKKTEKS